MKTLLCIDYASNWFEVFGKNCKLASGEPVKIEQAEWKDISLISQIGSKVTLKLARSDYPKELGNQEEERTISPDFVLVRNFPASGLHGTEFSNLVVGLMSANLPGVNSLYSIFMDMQRPLQHSQLIKAENSIKLKGGSSKIRVIPMNFYSNQGESIATNEKIFPCVVKVGSTHAGYGKSVAKNQQELDDIVSIIAMSKTYFTIEPFIQHIAFEYRIQVIGSNIRIFRRSSEGWKSNWGNIKFEDLPVLPHHREWAEECSKMHGGLDIFALDVLSLEDGQHEVLLEINATACGLMWEHEKEDNLSIATLVLSRMSSIFH